MINFLVTENNRFLYKQNKNWSNSTQVYNNCNEHTISAIGDMGGYDKHD